MAFHVAFGRGNNGELRLIICFLLIAILPREHSFGHQNSPALPRYARQIELCLLLRQLRLGLIQLLARLIHFLIKIRRVDQRQQLPLLYMVADISTKRLRRYPFARA